MKKIFLSFYTLGILLIVLISGCSQQQTAGNETPAVNAAQTVSVPPGVNLSSDNYLVSASGKTLYFFTKDISGESKCIDECLNAWPIFYMENTSASSELSQADFGTIERNDGRKQTVYKGWPLYYFSGDIAPGDINGEGMNNRWFVARPDYSIFIAEKDNMKFIVDSKGNTIYYFTRDPPGASNCTGGCLKNWPVFFTEEAVVPSIINASDFDVIINSEGSKQTTYRQMPLYYYINDKVRGDTNGDGVNNVWFIIESPDVSAVSSAAPVQNNVSTSSIKVTSYPSTAHGDTGITIQWEVSGVTPGEISSTVIVYGNKSGGENISEYPFKTAVMSGKTPGKFSTGINIPSEGSLYLRAYAIVDGADIYSPEYQISIIPQTSGGY